MQASASLSLCRRIHGDMLEFLPQPGIDGSAQDIHQYVTDYKKEPP